MRSHRLACASALLAVLFCHGCKDLPSAQADSAKLDASLHAAMARNDFQGIYDSADPGFREHTTADKSQALFSAISRKLGAPVSSKETAWNVNATTSGTYLRVACETKFAQNATATEMITWRKSGDAYHLYGYRIDSDDLISR